MTGKLAQIQGKLELVKVGEGFMSTGCGKQGSTVITVSHKGKRYETKQFSLVLFHQQVPLYNLFLPTNPMT